MDAQTLTHLIRINHAHRQQLRFALQMTKYQPAGHPTALKLGADIKLAELAARELASELVAKCGTVAV